MDTAEYTALANDHRLMDRLLHNVYYEWNKALTPGFHALWTDVGQQERARCSQYGLDILKILLEDPRSAGQHMNIYTYEQLEADTAFLEGLAAHAYVVTNPAEDAALFPLWEALETETQARYKKFGLRVVHSLVDDYTTPGCRCNYCRDMPVPNVSRSGRPIMCKQRWEALPSSVRMEISESMAD